MHHLDVVVKEVTCDLYGMELHIAALREAYLQCYTRIHMKSIPEVYKVNGTSITMERLHATPLDWMIRDGISEDKLVRITAKVCQMIRDVADAHIDHCNVTYENILVDEHECVWLTDFSTAKFDIRCSNLIFKDMILVYRNSVNNLLEHLNSDITIDV